MFAPSLLMRKPGIPGLMTILLTALLTACAVGPGPTTTTTIEPIAAPSSADLRHAEMQIEAALSLPSPERDYRLMQIAQQALADNNRESLANALDAIDVNILDHTGRARFGLLTGKLALLDRQMGRALTSLPAVVEGLPVDLAADIVETRATAFTLAGMIPQAVDQHIALERYLSSSEAVAANRAKLWEMLMTAGGIELSVWAERATSRLSLGWLELARIVKNNATRADALDEGIARWRARFPNHPADLSLLVDLRSEWQTTRLKTDRIAVLLPLTGHLGATGTAILDGILAAYHDSPAAHRPSLRVYDVSGDPGEILSHYRKAVAEGARVVIGPLDKNAVSILARAGSLPVPVLALNVADDVWPLTGLYQFGLNPEDETRQVAERTVLDGHERALVIAPRGEWGDRLARHFERRFVELGGRVLSITQFDPSTTDHSAIISETLLIDHSRARQRQLQSALGRKLQFEPRRRQDIDVVVMIATPQQARSLQPQLRFHYAHDLPVLATSHIYSGIPDPRNDVDLDGITYSDIPWLIEGVNPRPDLHAELQTQLSAASRNQPRLVALGIDAYGVLPVLQSIEGRRMRYDGVTGQLWTDRDGLVHRDLRWLRFQEGVPQLVGGTP